MRTIKPCTMRHVVAALYRADMTERLLHGRKVIGTDGFDGNTLMNYSEFVLDAVLYHVRPYLPDLYLEKLLQLTAQARVMRKRRQARREAHEAGQ